MLSYTEENYIKAVLQLTINSENKDVGNNKIAAHLDVQPATASDMLKKLKEKNLIDYEKYGKITLTEIGKFKAVELLRKHRLWETFLYRKLGFTWDEVHEIAEQLEHINSTKLTDKLDEFLGFPDFDPHGDIIPSSIGELKETDYISLSEVLINGICKITAVKDSSPAFLKYVSQLGLGLDSEIKVLKKQEFDGSLEIECHDKTVTVSKKFADNILVSSR